MKNLHNIEKIPGKHHYTGYAHGPWTIKRYASGKISWRAVHRDEPQHFPVVYGRTLGEVSGKLLKINAPRYAT